MNRINEAVSKYDPALRSDAASILMQRAFGSHAGSPTSISAGAGPATSPPVPSRAEFASLLEKWRPETQPHWALLGAYFHTKMQGKDTVTGQEINSTLKHYGTTIRNITDALGASMSASPALILQVGKSGSSRQARKTYKVTTAGVQFVERKLRSPGMHDQ